MDCYEDGRARSVRLAFPFKCLPRGVYWRWILTSCMHARPEDINQAIETYVMAAEGCGKTGKFFKSSKERRYNNAADDVKLQDKFFQEVEKLSGVHTPGNKSEL
jgi:hypothetical protein